ncbi:GntR family transcriptional regulator [Mesorhizobium sp. L48C026A00]|uniref:GntR family transcriptional regulator n=1 Tax=Mesorhizobium sp. L48C026A00 TaxID=1287182 RepID=UPI0003D03DD6|nr:GntR family transcriptional regulator [Mesorhizobium sp. L48C026A00]ESZ02029.1 hypothetical protein X737_38690 [Mesorhizobium sp. L48C026A00]
MELVLDPAGKADPRSRDTVGRQLRWSLVSGEFRPGEKIKLRDLAAQFGVSVTPVREALAQLVAAGALEQTPQKSIRVPALSLPLYDELRRLRLVLEPDLAMRAVSGISDEEIRDLEALSESLLAREALTSSLYRVGVARFHFSLYAAARQPCTLRVVEGLWLQSGPYLSHLFPEYIGKSPSPGLRMDICDALRRRDAVAVRDILDQDLRSAMAYLITIIEKLIPQTS